MKTVKLVIGILITIFASIYFLFAVSMYAMALSYGTQVSIIILAIPLIILIVGICLIVSAVKKKR
ncbi:MAG: hypothetical protein J6A05_10130 [Oscillospiraceae bacterium]|nr:hypothetical protein [Oscillospiraceae bacterium]